MIIRGVDMISYEALYAELNETEKKMNSAVAEAKKQAAAILKATEGGDLKGLEKSLGDMAAALSAQSEKLEEIKASLSSFDKTAYISQGDFKQQILDECEKQNVDVKETGGNVLEMFPNKVTINPESQDVSVDKKKLSCLRPSALVSYVKKEQEKMGKASFNEQRFIEDVYSAYEACIALETVKNTKKNKVISASVKLTEIYKKLAPTSRAKKDYDQLNFAYDISRVYSSEGRYTKNGLLMEIDTSRTADKNAIRILDAFGNEYFLTTVKFIDVDR